MAPSLTISGNATVDEGAVYTLNLASTDPGADTITEWEITWGDGNVETVTGNPASVTHTYADGDNNYTIRATATDEDGTTAANSIGVSVLNVAPSLTISGNATVDEGSVYTLNLASSDPGADTITEWEISWGDGNVETVTGNPASVTHTYADGDNNYTISATATDEDGTTAANSIAVGVLNVAPTLTISGNATVDEGAVYTLNLASSDPGADTITEWEINWGDGNVETVAGNPASVTHTYADGDNNYTISATATDEDGTTAANSIAVSVLNVAPSLTISGNATVDEGAVYTLNLASTDPGADTITEWEISWGDGNVETVTGNPASVTHTYADGDNNYTISATATDEDGTTAANSIGVSVLNVAPTLTISGNATVDEGCDLHAQPGQQRSGRRHDHRVGDQLGRRQRGDGHRQPGPVTHTYADGDNNYTIRATATDEDGTTAANSIAVSVLNVAPSLTISGNATVDEGAIYTLNLASSDPGADTITEWEISWGDGNVETVTGNPASVTHTYADGNNNYTIRATATDEDGTTAANSIGVSVLNVAPSLTISGNATVDEGAVYTLNLARRDPGADTITEWEISWGDGNVETVTGNPASVTHTYADGDNNYTITATATDEDGTTAANSIGVSVLNVAPSLTISGNATVDEGSIYTLNLASSDPGADTITRVGDHLGRRQRGDGHRQPGHLSPTPTPTATITTRSGHRHRRGRHHRRQLDRRQCA